SRRSTRSSTTPASAQREATNGFLIDAMGNGGSIETASVPPTPRIADAANARAPSTERPATTPGIPVADHAARTASSSENPGIMRNSLPSPPPRFRLPRFFLARPAGTWETTTEEAHGPHQGSQAG